MQALDLGRRRKQWHCGGYCIFPEWQTQVCQVCPHSPRLCCHLDCWSFWIRARKRPFKMIHKAIVPSQWLEQLSISDWWLLCSYFLQVKIVYPGAERFRRFRKLKRHTWHSKLIELIRCARTLCKVIQEVSNCWVNKILQYQQAAQWPPVT